MQKKDEETGKIKEKGLAKHENVNKCKEKYISGSCQTSSMQPTRPEKINFFFFGGGGKIRHPEKIESL